MLVKYFCIADFHNLVTIWGVSISFQYVEKFKSDITTYGINFPLLDFRVQGYRFLFLPVFLGANQDSWICDMQNRDVISTCHGQIEFAWIFSKIDGNDDDSGLL